LRADTDSEPVTPVTPFGRLVLPAVPGKDVMLALAVKLAVAVPTKPEPETLLVPLPESAPVEKPELCEEGITLEALDAANEEAVTGEVTEMEDEGGFEEPEKVAEDTCEPVAPADVAEVNEPETAEGRDVKVDENPPEVDGTAEPVTPERTLVEAETNDPDKVPVSNPDDVAKEVMEANPDDVAKEVIEANPDDVAEEVMEAKPHDVAKEVIEANPDDVPSELVETPENTPEDTPDDPIEIPLEAPDGSAERTPDEVPEAADGADPESDVGGDVTAELMMEVPEAVVLAPANEVAIDDEGRMDVAMDDMMEDVAPDGIADDVATDDGEASEGAEAAMELVAGMLVASTPVEVGTATVVDPANPDADTEVAIAESATAVPLDTKAFVALVG
jgi:hypothetical protein